MIWPFNKICNCDQIEITDVRYMKLKNEISVLKEKIRTREVQISLLKGKGRKK